eukprot:XP_014050666.1 PREDICTED: ubiquitin-like modifier-activating enzyme 6 [Salmo salar]
MGQITHTHTPKTFAARYIVQSSYLCPCSAGLFWQSPKRPPSPIEFDLKDSLHFSFVVSAARLYAEIYNIPYSEKDLSQEAVSRMLSEITIPEYRPAEKRIETDENVKFD